MSFTDGFHRTGGDMRMSDLAPKEGKSIICSCTSIPPMTAKSPLLRLTFFSKCPFGIQG